MSRPKYMVRPDDFEVFSLNEDGQTYSILESKKKYPDNFHHSHSYERLQSLGFIECDNLQYLNHKGDL